MELKRIGLHHYPVWPEYQKTPCMFKRKLFIYIYIFFLFFIKFYIILKYPLIIVVLSVGFHQFPQTTSVHHYSSFCFLLVFFSIIPLKENGTHSLCTCDYAGSLVKMFFNMKLHSLFMIHVSFLELEGRQLRFYYLVLVYSSLMCNRNFFS